MRLYRRTVDCTVFDEFSKFSEVFPRDDRMNAVYASLRLIPESLAFEFRMEYGILGVEFRNEMSNLTAVSLKVSV